MAKNKTESPTQMETLAEILETHQEELPPYVLIIPNEDGERLDYRLFGLSHVQAMRWLQTVMPHCFEQAVAEAGHHHPRDDEADI